MKLQLIKQPHATAERRAFYLLVHRFIGRVRPSGYGEEESHPVDHLPPPGHPWCCQSSVNFRVIYVSECEHMSVCVCVLAFLAKLWR